MHGHHGISYTESRGSEAIRSTTMSTIDRTSVNNLEKHQIHVTTRWEHHNVGNDGKPFCAPDWLSTTPFDTYSWSGHCTVTEPQHTASPTNHHPPTHSRSSYRWRTNKGWSIFYSWGALTNLKNRVIYLPE